ncbi:titin-like [Glandiceps talaboti]
MAHYEYPTPGSPYFKKGLHCIYQGNQITLEAHIGGSPELKPEWFWGSEIPYNTQTHIRSLRQRASFQNPVGKVRLVISNTQKEDSGTFYVKVTNAYNTLLPIESQCQVSVN